MSKLYFSTRRAKHPLALRHLLHHDGNPHDKWLLQDKETMLCVKSDVSLYIGLTRDVPPYVIYPQLPLPA